MKKIAFVYISLSGNTQSFVNRLSTFLESKYLNIAIEQIHIKDLVKERQAFFSMETPYIALLPTYLEGGNGVDNGDIEILTTDLADFITFEDNHVKCLGVVGSGNRNFNHQYCLTAKQYAKRFGFPVLDTFELRGLQSDIERVASIVEELYDL